MESRIEAILDSITDEQLPVLKDKFDQRVERSVNTIMAEIEQKTATVRSLQKLSFGSGSTASAGAKERIYFITDIPFRNRVRFSKTLLDPGARMKRLLEMNNAQLGSKYSFDGLVSEDMENRLRSLYTDRKTCDDSWFVFTNKELDAIIAYHQIHGKFIALDYLYNNSNKSNKQVLCDWILENKPMEKTTVGEFYQQYVSAMEVLNICYLDSVYFDEAMIKIGYEKTNDSWVKKD